MMLMRQRLFLSTALPLLTALLVSCTTSSTSTTEAANTSATAETAVDTTATAATASTPTASTPVDDTVVGGTEAATTTIASNAESGWTSEPIGTYSQFQGGVDITAFAPDGRGVAFTSVDTSCCSSATFGWARSADGTWKPIANTQETFVAGTVNGGLGGPDKVVWFKDRFIAAGTRGAGAPTDADTTPPAIPTIWTSPDGLAWTATETPGNSTPLDLQIALDGETLLGLWTAGENLDIRSTVDGTTWKPVSTITALASGRSLSGAKLVSVSSADDKPIRYAVMGSMSASSGTTVGFVSITADGITWKTQELPSTPEVKGASAENAVSFNGQIIVYGTANSEKADGAPVNTAVAWVSADGGATFAPLKLTLDCDDGTFSSIVVDKGAPEPTLFAVCTAFDGPPEGDFIPSIDKLLLTHDGAIFETPTAMSPEWSNPSQELSLGSVTTDYSGRVVLPVTKSNGDAGRIVTLWRS
jgi:hypothetical protein